MYKERREQLLTLIKQAYPAVTQGSVWLFAGFEHDRYQFRQESSFYYFTGIEEPGVVLAIDFSGKTTLYIPQCAESRAHWVSGALSLDSIKDCGVDTIKYTGSAIAGYTFSPLFSQAEYSVVLEDMKKSGAIFTLNSSHTHTNIEQKQILARVQSFDKNLIFEDISLLVARMRRKKSRTEIEKLYKAIEITMIAQHGAASAIANEEKESTVQAGIEYVFREAGARVAFPSIVGSGKNSCVLHYTQNNAIMRMGDLVVVDIGAEVQYYCADLTRTYPVSGIFNKRQKEIYNLVLETQEYIASKAKPGMWLKNQKYPDQSLHHLAKAFLDKQGYGQYFIHGIGHYLGMDVHDVGSYEEPLAEGDVFTIEPGIYIPQERIGIRIEDDYWMLKDSAECLSNELVKDAAGIEELAQSTLEDEGEYDEEYEDFD